MHQSSLHDRLGISRCCHLLTCFSFVYVYLWISVVVLRGIWFNAIFCYYHHDSPLFEVKQFFRVHFIDYWNYTTICILKWFLSLFLSLSPLQAMLVFKSVYLLITILVFRTSCVNGAEKSKKTVLNIGGIFPILGKGGWQGGQGMEVFFKYLLDF